MRTCVHVPSVERALTIIKSGSAIKSVLAVAGTYNASAEAALQALPDPERVSGLASLPDAYLRWALDTKAPEFATYADA